MDKVKITYLLEQYAKKELTSEQELELFALLSVNGDELKEEIATLIAEHGKLPYEISLSKLQPAIDQVIAVDAIHDRKLAGTAIHRVHFLKTTWFRYAAAIIFVLITGGYLLFQNNRRQRMADSAALSVKDITPGGERAVLTLADGSTIVLDSAANGTLANQGGTKIVKLDAGRLTYKSSEGVSAGYNTISTPKGGQYQILLPDGTRVWLNSVSSVRFPTSFEKNERIIEVKGEVYLEVAARPSQPFIIKADKTDIQVLGTSLNINAYSDEDNIKTTLLNGSIRVVQGSANKLLIPGQQALTENEHSSVIRVQAADVARVIAWKEGYFNFNGSDLKSVMREIGRWYDLDIVYEGEPANMEIMGEMGRKLNLSQVMDVLKNLGIRYRVEGRKLIVMQ